MGEQPKSTKAVWMRSRRSYRTFRRRKRWCNATVSSTTHRVCPSPLPCGMRRLAR